MRRSYSTVTVMALCLSLFSSCADELNGDDTATSATSASTEAIVLDGSDQEYELPTGSDSQRPVSVTVVEGDFVTPLSDGRVYLEQNDDGCVRTASIKACFANGEEQAYELAQQPASRVSGINSFVRHHGVGYSYDGIEGKYCDMNSLRSQVLNRAVLYKVDNEVFDDLYTENLINESETKSYYATSVEDYVQRNNFTATAEAKIAVFSGDISATLSTFEKGTKETYILHEERQVPKVEYSVYADNIRYYINKYPSLLTSSFRQAISNLKAAGAGDTYAVAEFVGIYGTHVVTEAQLGAKVSIDVQVEKKKFQTLIGKKLDYGLAFTALWNRKYSSEETQKIDSVLNNSRCRVSVLGGDVSLLGGVADMTTFGNVSTTDGMLDEWEESIEYDSDDLEHSNVELTDMEITPIWKFIPDEDVSDMVEAYITGNASLMLKMLGYRNFTNTSFNAAPESVTCKIGGVSQTFRNPDVVDIICANHHVATVCKELVPEISKEKKVWVAYPIYDGYVKLTNGLCLHNGAAYRVDWHSDKFTVDSIGEAPADGIIYMSLGELELAKSENLTYQTSHAILGCERPGGIDINGNLAGSMVKVKKHFGHFYLENTNKYDNLPNWSYVKTLPSEQANYKDYIGNEWRNRMVRNDDYVYIYNPKEASYE